MSEFAMVLYITSGPLMCQLEVGMLMSFCVIRGDRTWGIGEEHSYIDTASDFL